jgi:hypothetical protein
MGNKDKGRKETKKAPKPKPKPLATAHHDLLAQVAHRESAAPGSPR